MQGAEALVGMCMSADLCMSAVLCTSVTLQVNLGPRTDLLFFVLAGYGCWQLRWPLEVASCVAQEVVFDIIVRLRGCG